MSERPTAENDADPRPCKGRNANVCVAEGCYGEACVIPAAEPCVCDAFDYEAEGPCRAPGHDSRVTPIPPASTEGGAR